MLYIGTPITAGMSSGPARPAWVPSGAKIHIDFLGGTPQGRAWLEGTGVVALNSVVDLHGHAIVSQGVRVFFDTGLSPAFIGAAMTWLNAHVRQFTFTVEWQDSSTADPHPDAGVAIVFASENAASGVAGVDVGSRSAALSYLGAYASDTNGNYDVLGTLVVDGINKIAFRYLNNDTYASAFMGGAAIEGPTDGLHNSAYTLFCLGDGYSHCGYVRSFTLYDPLPTTAGLSALSALT